MSSSCAVICAAVRGAAPAGSAVTAASAAGMSKRRSIDDPRPRVAGCPVAVVRSLQMLLPLALMLVPRWGTPVDAGVLPPAASAAIEVLTVDLNHDALLDAVVALSNLSQGD